MYYIYIIPPFSLLNLLVMYISCFCSLNSHSAAFGAQDQAAANSTQCGVRVDWWVGTGGEGLVFPNGLPPPKNKRFNSKRTWFLWSKHAFCEVVVSNRHLGGKCRKSGVVTCFILWLVIEQKDTEAELTKSKFDHQTYGVNTIKKNKSDSVLATFGTTWKSVDDFYQYWLDQFLLNHSWL